MDDDNKKIKARASALNCYHNRKKHNDSLKKMKDRYHNKYRFNTEYNRAYGKYKYYNNKGTLDKFKERFPDQWTMLVEQGRIKALKDEDDYGCGSGSGSASPASPSPSTGFSVS